MCSREEARTVDETDIVARADLEGHTEHEDDAPSGDRVLGMSLTSVDPGSIHRRLTTFLEKTSAKGPAHNAPKKAPSSDEKSINSRLIHPSTSERQNGMLTENSGQHALQGRVVEL